MRSTSGAGLLRPSRSRALANRRASPHDPDQRHRRGAQRRRTALRSLAAIVPFRHPHENVALERPDRHHLDQPVLLRDERIIGGRGTRRASNRLHSTLTLRDIRGPLPAIFDCEWTAKAGAGADERMRVDALAQRGEADACSVQTRRPSVVQNYHLANLAGDDRFSSWLLRKAA
jgi:hypothetical protein